MVGNEEGPGETAISRSPVTRYRRSSDMPQRTTLQYLTLKDLSAGLGVSVNTVRSVLLPYCKYREADGEPVISGIALVQLMRRGADADAHLMPGERPAATTLRTRTRPEVRDRIVKRDGGMCRYCGRKATRYLQIDHLLPLSRGGTDDDVNLVAACPPCNGQKGNKTVEEAGMRLAPSANGDDIPNDRQARLAFGQALPLYEVRFNRNRSRVKIGRGTPSSTEGTAR